MEILAAVLPIVINILIVVLLVVSIILGIKCIYIIDKIKAVVLNVEEKVNSLNALFSIVSLVNNKVALITDKVASLFEVLMMKLFRKVEDGLEETEEE